MVLNDDSSPWPVVSCDTWYSDNHFVSLIINFTSKYWSFQDYSGFNYPAPHHYTYISIKINDS